MVPGTARHVFVQVVVARRENVETGACLVRDNDPVCVRKLLAVPGVHHGRIQRPAPHVGRVPARTRPRTRDRCGQQQIFGRGKRHSFSPSQRSVPALRTAEAVPERRINPDA